MPHNQPSQPDLRSGAYFHGKRYATVKICSSTPAAAARRYHSKRNQDYVEIDGCMDRDIVVIKRVC